MAATPEVVPVKAAPVDEPAARGGWGDARRRLVAAALGSGAIYALYAGGVAFLPYNLTRRNIYLFGVLGYRPYTLLLYIAAVVALFALAALAREAVRAAPGAAADRGLRRWALAPPILFALLLTPTQPLASRDLFHYLMSGRILGVYGANPYLLPPSAFPADPFFQYTNWPNYTSPYGPLWAVLGAGVTRLGGDSLIWSVLLFKLVALAGYLACGAVLWRLLRRLGRPPLPGVVLWLWNPLVLFEFPGNGHNDVLMLAGMLLGLWWVVAGRPRAGLAALAVAALVKYVALALIPLVAWRLLRPLPSWRARAREAVRLLWLPGTVFVGGLAPFWVGARTLGPLREVNEYYSSLPHVLRIALEWFLSPTLAGRLVQGVIMLSLLGGYALLLRRAGGGTDDLLAAAAGTMLLLIVLWSFFVPWYIGWAVALVATLGAHRLGSRVLLLSALAMLAYPLQLYLPGRRAISVEWRSTLSALLIFVPFLLALRRRGGGGRRAG